MVWLEVVASQLAVAWMVKGSSVTARKQAETLLTFWSECPGLLQGKEVQGILVSNIFSLFLAGTVERYTSLARPLMYPCSASSWDEMLSVLPLEHSPHSCVHDIWQAKCHGSWTCIWSRFGHQWAHLTLGLARSGANTEHWLVGEGDHACTCDTKLLACFDNRMLAY